MSSEQNRIRDQVLGAAIVALQEEASWKSLHMEEHANEDGTYDEGFLDGMQNAITILEDTLNGVER